MSSPLVLVLAVTLVLTSARSAHVAKVPHQPMRGHSDGAEAAVAFGPTVALDTKGVDFSPWIRPLNAEIRRHWFIPYAATWHRGHVVVTFDVRRDGTIENLVVAERCPVAEFNDAALNAVAGVKRTAPLPDAYPLESAHFTLTFFCNESPPS